jgi:hypothetical protein
MIKGKTSNSARLAQLRRLCNFAQMNWYRRRLKIEQSLWARACLDKSLPVSSARAHEFFDNQMVAGIHGTHVNFFVWKDDDNVIFNVDGHLLVGVYGTRGKYLDLLKKWLATPGGGVARVDVDCDEVALMPHEHLALVGPPLRTQSRRCEPGAKKFATLRWPRFIDCATAAAGGAVSAPSSNRLVESFNPEELAAQRAFAATSSRQEWDRVSRVF